MTFETNSDAASPRRAVDLAGFDRDLEPLTLRRAFGAFPSGVVAVCGLIDDQPVGIACSSFTSVSLDPALVSICIANTSTTWPVLRAADRLGISVLSDAQQGICGALSSRGVDRFATVPWGTTEDGAVLIEDASLWIECSIDQEVPAGDHVIVLARIHAVSVETHQPPMIFHGSAFRSLAVPA
ncbi:flavin reductase family protein [Streptomyces canus]|uniref:flavin reductase family protein n=1 Tax=Streptomyces canus TaxID=58343 RepID=UPI0036949AFC